MASNGSWLVGAQTIGVGAGLQAIWVGLGLTGMGTVVRVAEGWGVWVTVWDGTISAVALGLGVAVLRGVKTGVGVFVLR